MTRIETAVVLAAGYGTRLRPLTTGRAKPALPFFESTILEHVLDVLEAAGIRRVIINLHHHGWTVRRNLRHRRRRALEIIYSYEPEILGTAGALVPVKHKLHDQPFVLINGDVLTDINLESAIKQHLANPGILATLVLHPLSLAMGFPSIGSSHDNVLTRFPYGLTSDEDTDWSGTFTGIHIINPDIFRYINDMPFQCINSTVYARALNAGEQLGAYRHDGYWNDVGTPARYFNAHIDVMDGRVTNTVMANPGTSHQWIHPDARIDPGTSLQGSIVVGANAVLGSHVYLENVIVWPDTRIRDGVYKNGILMKEGAFVHLHMES